MTLEFDPIDEAERHWHEREWSSPLAMIAATSISRANQIALARINAQLASLELNFSRFEALALLSFTQRGELPLGKLGDRLQVHLTSVTNTIDRLESDGLVERVPHPQDRRTTLARITPRGRQIAEIAADALGEIKFGLDGLSDAQLRAIAGDLRDLRAHAGDFETSKQAP